MPHLVQVEGAGSRGIVSKVGILPGRQQEHICGKSLSGTIDLGEIRHQQANLDLARFLNRLLGLRRHPHGHQQQDQDSGPNHYMMSL